jgi:hypothetical protein
MRTLADVNQQLLLREIAARAPKHLRQTQPEEQKAVKVIGIDIETPLTRRFPQDRSSKPPVTPRAA